MASATSGVNISYEQLTKAVEQLRQQISLKRELVLKERGYAVIPEALRF